MSRLNFYLIILIVFALPSYLVKFSVLGIPTTVLELLIYIVFVLTIILKIRNSKSEIRNKFKIEFIIPVILFILAGLISIFISPDKQMALGIFKAYIFDPILFFAVLIINLSEKQVTSYKLQVTSLKSLILSGVVLSIHAIYQYLIGDLTPDGRVLGIYKLWENASPNYLALYLAPIAVLHIAYRISHIDKKLSSLLLYYFTTLLLLFTLYLTGSRAAIGAVVVGISALLVMKYWAWTKVRKFATLLLYCLIALLLIIFWYSIKPDFSLSPEKGGRITSSNNIRWEIYKTTGEILKDKWLLGVGLGNYQNYFTNLTQDRVNYPEYISPRALTPHNVFLNIWVNLGLLGLIALIWLLIAFFRQIKKDQYSLIFLATMITVLAQGMLDTPYWKNDLAVFFWMILALSVIRLENHTNLHK